MEFIAMIAPAAKALELSSKIPASFTIAQAAVESGWGARAANNNLFGIKADASWTGPTTLILTHEDVNGVSITVRALFRAYPDWAASLVDHAKFLTENRRYAGAFKCDSGKDFTIAVANAGYATDPNYASVINSIIDTHQLERFDS